MELSSSFFLFWTMAAVGCIWLVALTWHFMEHKRDTQENTHRIDKLEITVEDILAMVRILSDRDKEP